MSKYRFRLGELGSAYHVFSRGLDRKPLFQDDRDRNTFLLIVRDVLEATDTRCLAFALMGNHHHNVLRTIGSPISEVMHRINTRYALHHNRRHGGVGHVFQGRFGSVLIEDESHLTTAISYVHANPIRAGTVPGERALREYPWTSYSAVMGRTPHTVVDVDRVLTLFGRTEISARRSLSRITRRVAARSDADDGGAAPIAFSLENAIPLSARDAESLTAESVAAIAGESARLAGVLAARDERTATRLRLAQAGWTSDRLLRRICRLTRASPRAVRAGRQSPRHCRARALFCHFATTTLGLSLVSAGGEVALGRSGASSARRSGALLAEREGPTPIEVFGRDVVLPLERSRA